MHSLFTSAMSARPENRPPSRPPQRDAVMQRLVPVAVLALALLLGLAATAKAGRDAPQGIVDLNRATLLELIQLPGVGPHRAQAILDFRKARPFRRSADLMRIKGIGRHIFTRIKPLVTVAEEAAAAGQPSTAGGHVAERPSAGGSTRATGG